MSTTRIRRRRERRRTWNFAKTHRAAQADSNLIMDSRQFIFSFFLLSLFSLRPSIISQQPATVYFREYTLIITHWFLIRPHNAFGKENSSEQKSAQGSARFSTRETSESLKRFFKSQSPRPALLTTTNMKMKFILFGIQANWPPVRNVKFFFPFCLHGKRLASSFYSFLPTTAYELQRQEMKIVMAIADDEECLREKKWKMETLIKKDNFFSIKEKNNSWVENFNYNCHIPRCARNILDEPSFGLKHYELRQPEVILNISLVRFYRRYA